MLEQVFFALKQRAGFNQSGLCLKTAFPWFLALSIIFAVFGSEEVKWDLSFIPWCFTPRPLSSFRSAIMCFSFVYPYFTKTNNSKTKLEIIKAKPCIWKTLFPPSWLLPNSLFFSWIRFFFFWCAFTGPIIFPSPLIFHLPIWWGTFNIIDVWINLDSAK